MKTKLVVSSGQYEQVAHTVTINHRTWTGLCRRITQLRNEYASFGDNHAGWIKADIALADERDEWGNNTFVGGQWCKPYHGWLVDDDDSVSDEINRMSFDELKEYYLINLMTNIK